MFAACALWLDLGAVGRTLQRVSLLWLALILAVMTLDRLLMAWKWAVLLWAVGLKVPFSALVRFFYQGTFAGTFLPTSLGGDALRAYLVVRATGATYPVVASLAIEKAMGLLSAVSWALAGMAYFLHRSPAFPAVWAWGLLAVAAGGHGAFWLSLHPRCRAAVHRWLSASRSRLAQGTGRFLEAYVQYGKHRRALAWNGMLTVVEHGLQLCIVLAMAYGLGIVADPLLFLSVATVHTLLYRLPIAPDGWGVGEASAIGLYGLIGILPEQAFSLAFLSHVMQLLVALPGIWFMGRDIYSVR
ncbi:MAG: hypothetical protein KatS3mg131_3809 [Candidatus Tectimicrobiota bacterium]|nr:MAG: hypothetical protein KatS3mg131_3809 [Candidatus Tectomicrobia bacterium]